MNNVLITFKTIHCMKRKTKGEVGDVALKIDISKTYDRVDWEFLRQIMIKHGFATRWMDTIMLCVTSISYSVFVNDHMVIPIMPKYGLRQGDLSSYLFIICVEGLSCSIKDVISRGLLYGSRICKGAPAFSHLLFVDDYFSSSKLLLMSVI